MSPIVLALPRNAALGDALAEHLGADRGVLEMREFPDGEAYVRIGTAVAGRDVILACTLHRPDHVLLPLLLVAATARDLGARRVGLVAPYLAYMRQDARFRPGEGITSAYVAKTLSRAIDWLVTVDPHLHRHATLDAIYTVPSRVVSASPTVAAWIQREVVRPVIVGPDAESAQWVSAIAAEAGVPHIVLDKVRHGDRDVAVSPPDLAGLRDHTPVIVDDIISTAQTMVETVAHLRRADMIPPVCIGVHAVFATDAEAGLRAAGAARVVTTTTIRHPTNAIEMAPAVAAAVATIPNLGA